MEDDDSSDEDTWWYVCTLCYQAFTGEARFKAHRSTVHGSKSAANLRILSQSADLSPTVKLLKITNPKKIVNPSPPPNPKPRPAPIHETMEIAQLDVMLEPIPEAEDVDEKMDFMPNLRSGKHQPGTEDYLTSGDEEECPIAPSPGHTPGLGAELVDAVEPGSGASNLKSGTGAIRVGRSRVSCPVCGTSLYDKSTLRKHLERKHAPVREPEPEAEPEGNIKSENECMVGRLNLRLRPRQPTAQLLTAKIQTSDLESTSSASSGENSDSDYSGCSEVEGESEDNKEIQEGYEDKKPGCECPACQKHKHSDHLRHQNEGHPWDYSVCIKDAFLRPSLFPGLWECKLCEEKLLESKIRKHVEEKHPKHEIPLPWSGGAPSEWRAAKAAAAEGDEQRGTNSRYECPICLKTFAAFRKYRCHANEAHNHTKNRECPVCHKVYSSEEGLRQHQALHSRGPARNHLCSTCGKAFKTKTALSSHITCQHKQRGTYQCELCSKTFWTLKNLTTHKDRTHAKESFTCPECGKVLKNDQTMKSHLKLHSKDSESRPFKCEVCKTAAFKSLGTLRVHAAVHMVTRPFPCPQCEGTFKTKYDLKIHVRRVHNKATANVCRVCAKIFPGPQSVRRHELEEHNFQRGSKRYKCAHCDKIFPLPSRLRQHDAMHTNERPFTCETCGERFKLYTHLRQHKRSHLKYEELPHVCDHGDGCGRRFGTAAQLRNHKKRVHEPDSEDES